MRILVTGATGFVGTKLVKALLLKNHHIVILSRNIHSVKLPASIERYQWNPLQELPPKEAMINVDALIHLAGESIVGGRWTSSQKQRIYSSRVDSTKNLLRAFSEYGVAPPKIFIGASAVGIYGADRGEEVLTENSSLGGDFLAKVCRDWEAEQSRILQSGEVRWVSLRTGIVLGKNGGLYASLLPLFRLGLGGILGDGRQWMSWIHLDDLLEVILAILSKDSFSGPLNAVAPEPVRNHEFTKIFAESLRSRLFLGVPRFAIKLMMGEMADFVLGSLRVSPECLKRQHFEFAYPDLKSALIHLAKAG